MIEYFLFETWENEKSGREQKEALPLDEPEERFRDQHSILLFLFTHVI